MPGVHDALSAKLIARSGRFECAFMSGYGVAASGLGDPDGNWPPRRWSTRESPSAEPLATCPGGDGDTGFGGVANVGRTVFEYHAAGFAAVSIEDQVFPKRCATEGRSRPQETRSQNLRRRSRRDEIRAKEGTSSSGGRTPHGDEPEIEDNFKEAILLLRV